MFRHVQKRLVFLYTFLTGGILSLLLSCVFLWNISTKEQEAYEAFQALWLTSSSHFQTDLSLSHTYLAQTEAASLSIIHIEENGTPFLYSGSWISKTPRTQLIEIALKEAELEGISPLKAPVSSSTAQSSVFVINGIAKDSYYGRLLVASTPKGVKSFLLLTYITPRFDLIWELLPFFLAACFIGILGIFFVSLFFTSWSLKPARESVKRQTEFIAAASHELRSPLAVIRSSASALEYNPDRSLLMTIDKECERMGRLISDLLLLASTDAKNWTLCREEVEIDTLLIETYEAFLPLCREKGIQIKLVLPEESLPILSADRQRLKQILSILLDNGISYTPEGKAVTIRAYKKMRSRRAGISKVMIEVQDQGPGISDDMKQRIFDRFYRGDASRNDKNHFGLGLCTAKELAELHGGKITVLDHPGGGARFVLTLFILSEH